MANFPVDIWQVTLQANVPYAIVPRQQSRRVMVINSSADEVDVYAITGDATTLLRIGAGYDHVFDVSVSSGYFQAGAVSFYLQSPSAGIVTLKWT